jgi:hypothetical protein
MSNHFDGTVSAVQAAPQGQRVERAIEGICQQMQQSGNQPTQQLGAELTEAKPRLLKAINQQQQGG